MFVARVKCRSGLRADSGPSLLGCPAKKKESSESACGQQRGAAGEHCARGEAQDDTLCGFPIMVPTQRLVAAPGGGEEWALVASTASRFLRASA